MFGYVRPLQEELKVRDLRRWQEDYCGLCRCLSKRHGFFARFLLSYDMTFLYSFLTMDRQPEKPEKCWCPAGVLCRKPCRRQDMAMEFVADMTVLLAYWKLRDEQKDGSFFHRLGARMAAWLFRPACGRAAAAWEKQDYRIRIQLAKLDRLEKARSDSIDETADAFARILQGFAAWWRDPAQRRPAEQALYQIGRYVYLVDALDDLRKDCRRGSYNPLRFRFHVQDGMLRPEDMTYLLQIMNVSIDLAGSAFELMKRTQRGAVTENIIYYGLPAVLKAVAEGRFNHRKKQVRT